MSQKTLPFLEGKYGWDLGESNWNLGMDENLVKFSFMFDRNIDDVVSSLPSPATGTAYFLTTDNRIYYAPNNTTWYSSPTPKWFILVKRSTGEYYQFNGTGVNLIPNNSNLGTRVSAVELTVSTLGTAAFRPETYFAVATTVPTVVASFTAMRALSKTTGPKGVFFPSVGWYYIDLADTTSTDDGGMTIVATDGGRWKILNNTRATNITYKEFGAVIKKVGDRLFVGGASLHNGTNVASQPDWLTTFQLSPAVGRVFSFQQTAQFAVLNDGGGNAGNASLFGAQSLNFTGPGNAAGIVAVAVNNNTTQSYAGAYAAYLETYQMPAAPGPAYGLEIDVMNYRANVTTDPYLQSNYQVNGIQLAAGGENANLAGQFPSTNGINFWNNGQVYNCGINFGFNSLAGADGVNGTAIAIAFGKGHMMQWYAGAGIKTASIHCTGTTLAASIRQEFLDNQLRFRNSANTNIFQVLSVSNGVNFLQVSSSATNTPIQITAGGTDTNRGIQFVTAGTEVLWFGTYTAGAVTQTGYITIKDQAGTIRRLLVG